jgi:hypothetical protein
MVLRVSNTVGGKVWTPDLSAYPTELQEKYATLEEEWCRGCAVAIIEIGPTERISQELLQTTTWRRRTCCLVPMQEAHVTRVTVVATFDPPFPFSDGNFMPLDREFPAGHVPQHAMVGCHETSTKLREKARIQEGRRD